MGAITREHVAKAAGVSKTTVTYVLRETPGTHISEATKARVLSAARALGYQPDFAASSLVRGTTEIVGLLLPSQDRQFSRYYSQMIGGMIEAASETPYHFLYLAMDHPAKYERCLRRGLLDGLIVLQSNVDDTHIARVKDWGKPAITVNYLNKAGLPAVSLDYEGGLELAYERMAAASRRRVAFVCAHGNCQPNLRHLGLHERLAKQHAGRTKFRHFFPEKSPSQRALLETLSEPGAYDGFVVDGFDLGRELAFHLQALGRAFGADTDMVVFRVGTSYQPMPAGVVVLDAQPERVGALAWTTMRELLDGRPIGERVRLVPYAEHKSEDAFND